MKTQVDEKGTVIGRGGGVIKSTVLLLMKPNQ